MSKPNATALAIGDEFQGWKVTKLLENTARDGKVFLINCLECNKPRRLHANRHRRLMPCECTSAPKRGRNASVLLTSGGQTLSVRGWAEVVNPEKPARAEAGIRYRLWQRNKGYRNYTDAQVIYGITRTAPEDMPIEMGLPRLVEKWVTDALLNYIEDMVEDIKPKMAAYIQAEINKAIADNILNNHKGENSHLPVADRIQPASFVGVGEDVALDFIRQWLTDNGIVDDTFEDRYLSDTMLDFWSGDELIPERLHELALSERGTIDIINQSVEPKTAPVIIDQNPYQTIYLRNAWDEGLRAPDIIEEVAELYPPLSNEEEETYTAYPWVSAFNGADPWRLQDSVIDRYLKDYDEYWFMLHNPEVVANRAVFSAPSARFQQFCMYDIAWRCVMGIVDHRSFNRAMETYYMGRILGQKGHLWTKEPSTFVQMAKRALEMEQTLVDMPIGLMVSPAVASAMQTEYMAKEPVQRTLTAIRAIDADKVGRSDLYNWFMLTGKRANLTPTLDEDGENTGELMIELALCNLPDYVDEAGTEAMMKIFELCSNYGRNRAKWPVETHDIEIPYPHLVPCDLYYNVLGDRDYSVFDGAPVLEHGTHTYLNVF
jgi:hypothetical protein